MKTLEAQLQSAGLQVLGCCESLEGYGADLLQIAPLLQDMTPAEANILFRAMVRVRADPGQVMIREGEAGEWMLLVLKGSVDVTKRIELQLPGPKTIAANASATAAESPVEVSRVAVIPRGGTVGEMSMLDSEPRYSTCTAIEAVEAGVLGRQAIGLLIRDHPGVGAKLLVKITQLMAQRLRNASNQLVKLLREKQGNPDADTATAQASRGAGI